MGVIACAGCDTKVNSEAPGCPECGADPRTGHSTKAAFSADRAELQRASYLGGLPWAPNQRQGKLIFTAEKVGFGDTDADVLLWTAEIVSVDVVHSAPAKVGELSAGAKTGLYAAGMVTFGLAGVAAAATMGGTDTVNRVTLVVNLKHGDQALQATFTVDDLYPNNIRDRLSPLLDATRVPLRLPEG